MMRSIVRAAVVVWLCLSLANLVAAGEKRGKVGKDVKTMSQD